MVVIMIMMIMMLIIMIIMIMIMCMILMIAIVIALSLPMTISCFCERSSVYALSLQDYNQDIGYVILNHLLFSVASIGDSSHSKYLFVMF